MTNSGSSASLRLSKSDIKTLSARGWLSRCSAAFRDELLSQAHIRRFAAGECIYHYGDPADALYGVIDGGTQATVPADDGQEFTAHRDEQGFWVGDLAMLSDQTRLVSVFATRPTRTACIPAVRIREMVERNPDYYRAFYALSHENMQTALRILANLAVTSASQRLILRLLHAHENLADADGWMRLSQEELAAMVAVSPATLQRELKKLGEQGLIEAGYGRIRLRDTEAMKRFCQT